MEKITDVFINLKSMINTIESKTKEFINNKNETNWSLVSDDIQDFIASLTELETFLEDVLDASNTPCETV
jgi:t-SNARE complex subunit (syntaxin)